MAKNKARVVIIVSGLQASAHGNTVQAAILSHPECKHKPDEVTVVSVEDAEREAAPRPKEGPLSLIWIIASKEWNGKIPETLSASLPKRFSDLPEGAGISQVEISSPKAKGLAFIVEIVAPDGERLAGLIDTFKSKSAPLAEGLPYTIDYLTYKLAAFSAPEDKGFAETWGHVSRATWTDYKWFPLQERDKLTPEQLDEYHQVYFIDRSRKDGPLPACIAPLLAGRSINETTALVRRGDLGHGLLLAVFTMPNQAILEAKSKRYGSFGTIPGGQASEEVKDLRRVGQATLVITGSGPNAGDKESIRLLTARSLRDSLHVRLEERIDLGEPTLEELQGAGGSADTLRRKGRLRYVWLFHILEYGGGTEYSTKERLIDEQKLVPYEETHSKDDPEPQLVINSVGGGRKDEIARKEPIFKRDHEAWLERKKRFEDRQRERLTAQFEREISVTMTARVRGILRLVDLKDGNSPIEVLWEQECRGLSVKGPESYQRDTVIVRAGKRPSSLMPPANSDTCPADILKRAAVQASSQGVAKLKETAWLSDGTEQPAGAVAAKAAEEVKPADTGVAAPPETVKAPVAAKLAQPVVANVDGNTVTITREGLADVKVGDRAMVILKMETIKHPATGEVLREKILESITLKIVHVDAKTLDGEPVSAAEAAKLPRVQLGAVAKIWRPRPAP